MPDYWKFQAEKRLYEYAASYRFFNRVLFIGSATVCLIFTSILFSEAYSDIVYATLWALMLTVGQSILNIDREVLRFSLAWRKLILLNVSHKLTTIIAIYILLNKSSGDIRTLAVFVSIQQVVFMLFYQIAAFGFGDLTQNLFYRPGIFNSALKALKEFSYVHHLNWTIFAAVQSLDILIWGSVQAERKLELGIYSGVLKVTNLVTAIPSAMGITLDLVFPNIDFRVDFARTLAA